MSNICRMDIVEVQPRSSGIMTDNGRIRRVNETNLGVQSRTWMQDTEGT